MVVGVGVDAFEGLQPRHHGYTTVLRRLGRKQDHCHGEFNDSPTKGVIHQGQRRGVNYAEALKYVTSDDVREIAKEILTSRKAG